MLGTGTVGRAIESRLVALGHEVTMGSRTPDNEAAAERVSGADAGASQGTFAEAASFGELVFNCTAGSASLDDPSLVPGEHDMFVRGKDAAAREQVTALLESVRLAAGAHPRPRRHLELAWNRMYVVLWLRLWGVLGMAHFKVHVDR